MNVWESCPEPYVGHPVGSFRARSLVNLSKLKGTFSLMEISWNARDTRYECVMPSKPTSCTVSLPSCQ